MLDAASVIHGLTHKGWPTFREWPEIGAGALWEREYAGANPVSLTSEC
jgi:hypothetical protein